MVLEFTAFNTGLEDAMTDVTTGTNVPIVWNLFVVDLIWSCFYRSVTTTCVKPLKMSFQPEWRPRVSSSQNNLAARLFTQTTITELLGNNSTSIHNTTLIAEADNASDVTVTNEVQCSHWSCNRWFTVPDGINIEDFPDVWTCEMRLWDQWLHCTSLVTVTSDAL